MVDVSINRDLARNLSVSVAIVVLTLPVVWIGISLGKLGLFAVVGVIGLIVGVYVGLMHPLWYFWGLALIMAGLPFARIPGIGLPIWYLLAIGAIVAAFVHPRFARSTHPLEIAMWALYLTSALSMVIKAQSTVDFSIFIRFSLGALFMFALSRLAPEHAVRFGRIFVVAAAVNALYGMFQIAFDPGYKTLAHLRVFGYTAEALVARVAYAGDTASTSSRLGGTWVEPNGAGLTLIFALALAFLLFTGWRRGVLVTVIVVALVLTLSRSAIFTVIAGILLMLAFHPMRTRARVSILSLVAVGAVAALLAEPIRRRLFSSFGQGDAGSAARADALRVFPGRMSGHWGFGWGWARPEFIDPVYSYTFNLPANAALVTLYRQGSIAFIAFMVLMIVGCVYAYRAVRSNSFARAMYGAMFIALCVVAMQLDHPLGTTAAGALLYSMFLGFLVYVDRARTAELHQENAPPDAGGTDALVGTVGSAPRVTHPAST